MNEIKSSEGKDFKPSQLYIIILLAYTIYTKCLECYLEHTELPGSTLCHH